MRRLLCGLAFSSLLLTACSSTPEGHSSGTYISPAQAFALELNNPVFRGSVRLTEQCDGNGGTLNIWDSNNRFFRVDYLKINKSPLAMVPAFANERTMADIVLASYLRDVLPKAPGIRGSDVMFKNFVNTKRGEALLGIVGLSMKDEALPAGVTSTSYYYGFLILQKGDFAYVVQHRADSYQPDRLKNILVGLAAEMAIPGKLRGSLYDSPAIDAKGSGGLGGSLFNRGEATVVNCN